MLSKKVNPKVYLVRFYDVEIRGYIRILITTTLCRQEVGRIAYEIQEEYDKIYGDFDDIEEAIEWLEKELTKRIQDVDVIDFEIIDADEGWKFIGWLYAV